MDWSGKKRPLLPGTADRLLLLLISHVESRIGRITAVVYSNASRYGKSPVIVYVHQTRLEF